MIFVTDATGKATYISPEWQALTGQRLAQSVSFGWAAVVHPDDVEVVRQIVQDAIRAQSEFSVQYRLLRRTGGYVWMKAGAVPSYGPPGRTFLGFFGSIMQLPETAAADSGSGYGSLGPLPAIRPISTSMPASLIELAADHLITAHSLLTQGGGRRVLPALETTLHLIGVELAKAAQSDPGPANLH